ncbi:hypothetical protein IFM89_005657 [Coptis chinensis]|uniref:Neprosin PEP catalytic domain-containing protein n=1 Tax=Coptis chinensis TaxID=261450 RepID=A0A835LCU0_9MAGN|nr:hypothetical protein IFM89_005657 [Coptis chinensis]
MLKTTAKRINGAQAMMNTLSPIVKPGQSSWSLIWYENGELATGEYDYIIAGWTVAPALNRYHDYKTRFITYWSTISNHQVRGGCYNVLCPGFVQVDSNYPLDQVFSNISVYNGPQFFAQVAIFQDPVTNNIWLTLNSRAIGYWPSAILPHLVGGANYVAWGGLAIASSDGISPPMGFGVIPYAWDYKHAGIFKYVQVFDTDHQWTVPYGNWDKYEDNSKCYSVFLGYLTQGNADEGWPFTYGGPGGECGV